MKLNINKYLVSYKREHPVGGEPVMYTSTAIVRFAPRIHDGRIISVDLCKEEN